MFFYVTAFGFVMWIMTKITIMSVILLDMISSIKLAYLQTFSTWGSISTMRIDLYIDENVSCDLFLDWCRASLSDDNVKSLEKSLDIIVFTGWIRPSVVDDDVLQLFFDCKKCVTTVVRSGTWEQARSFWHRRLDEVLLSLIFRVSCNLFPYVIKKEKCYQDTTDEKRKRKN